LDLAKKKVEKPRREPTKRQLSRWQQQKRRQRFIFTIGMAIIVVVLGLLGTGVYYQWYLPEYKIRHETVVEVNGTKFDMDYYLKMLKYYYVVTQASMTDLTGLAEQVVKAIEQNELIRQEAMGLGISVSESEVNEQLNSYDPPMSEDYRDVVRTQLLVARLLDEYFDKQVPKSAEQRHILAMFLESESQANEVVARLASGEGFLHLAGELSLDAICKENEGNLGWRPKGVLSLVFGTPVLDEYAFSCEVGVLSPPLPDETKTKEIGYWLIEVLARDDEARVAQLKVMLLGSEQEASEIRARLEAGEDFAQLAQEFSQHDDSKYNGGNFSVSEDMMGAAFNDFVFNSEVGVLSQPIFDDTVGTKGGYWLVTVTEIDSNRQIVDDDRALLKNDALNKWVEGLFTNPKNKIESYLDGTKTLWAVTHVIGD